MVPSAFRKRTCWWDWPCASRSCRIAASGCSSVLADSSSAQAATSLKSVSGSSAARSSSPAVTRVALRVIIAVVRAFTAVSRAILISHSASICPSAVFGCAIRVPESTWRAACSASMVSLLPDIRRSPLRGGRWTSWTVCPWRRRKRARPMPYEPVPSTPNDTSWPSGPT